MYALMGTAQLAKELPLKYASCGGRESSAFYGFVAVRQLWGQLET